MVIRILLADDHQAYRRQLRAFLDQDADLTVVGEAEDGRAAAEYLAGLGETDARLAAAGEALAPIRAPLGDAARALGEATGWLRETWPRDPDSAAAGATCCPR